MKKYIFALLLLSPIFAFAKLQVATTTTDLAALVTAVGQDKVEVFSIAKGTQDPHQIEAKPSFMVKLRNTDIVFAQGLELESAWITPLIQGARNSKLTSKDGVYEIAQHLDPIEIPKADVSRAEGDVHPGGNPHFQLDPIRLGVAAVLMADRLGELEPESKAFFVKNAQAFQKRMTQKSADWQARLKKTGVKELVTYHKNFSYFCDRFKITCTIQLEPKPGIPPTASHLMSVIEQMKKRDLHMVLIENLYDDSVKEKLKQGVGKVEVVRVPVMVDGDANVSTNEKLIENLVKVIESGVQQWQL